MRLKNFFDLLVSPFFLYEEDNKSKKNDKSTENSIRYIRENYKIKEIEVDSNNILQYESFLPIDGIVFYIGAYSPSESHVNNIIKNVLEAKKLVLKDRDIAKSFNNFSELASDKSPASMLVKMRNQLLNQDKSYIMKNITREFLSDRIIRYAQHEDFQIDQEELKSKVEKKDDDINKFIEESVENNISRGSEHINQITEESFENNISWNSEQETNWNSTLSTDNNVENEFYDTDEPYSKNDSTNEENKAFNESKNKTAKNNNRESEGISETISKIDNSDNNNKDSEGISEIIIKTDNSDNNNRDSEGISKTDNSDNNNKDSEDISKTDNSDNNNRDSEGISKTDNSDNNNRDSEGISKTDNSDNNNRDSEGISKTDNSDNNNNAIKKNNTINNDYDIKAYEILGENKIIKILYTNKENLFDKEKNVIKDFNRDKEYRRMIFRLKSAIEEKKNLSRILKEEKEEFYRNFVKYDKAEIFKAKIEISLGSYIISTSMLGYVFSKINIPDRDLKIREWMYKIMKNVENIELRIGTKSAIEKKFIIKNLLEDCLDKKNEELNELFDLRSNILLKAFNSEEKLKEINLKQEKHIKYLISIVENMKNEDWIIKYNKDIVEDFIKYLLTNLKQDKNKLLKHFINK